MFDLISSDKSSYSDDVLLYITALSQIFIQSIDAIDVTFVTLSRLNGINAIDVTRVECQSHSSHFFSLSQERNLHHLSQIIAGFPSNSDVLGNFSGSNQKGFFRVPPRLSLPFR